MKKPSTTSSLSRRLSLAVLAGASLLSTLTTTPAQTITTSYTNRFNTAANAASWNYWYDLPQTAGSPLMGWSDTNNFGGPVGSGSLPYIVQWPGTPGGGQIQIYGTFAEDGQYNTSQSIDPTKYDSVSFDIYVDPSSPTNSAGDMFLLTVGLFNSYSVYTVSNAVITTAATNGFVHIVAPINKATAPTTAQGVAFNINCYGGVNQSLKNQSVPTAMWIDNIIVTRSKTVNPPPTLSSVFADAPPGLNLYLGNQYDRTSLRLVNTAGNSWVGQPDTTYSFTIDRFPDGSVYTNNQAHIFIATPDNASSIDYNTTNLIWLNVQANTDGTATAYFRYKIGMDHANSNMFGAEYTNGAVVLNDYTNRNSWGGQIGSLTASTAIGTWGMTFNQDTNVILTGPGGVTTNFSMNELIPTFFAADPLAVVFGAQPNNNPPATGQPVVLSRATITNNVGAVIVEDNFLADAGVLDTLVWTISASSAINVQLFPADLGQKLVKWTIPDTAFGLQVSTNLANSSSWTTLTGSEAGSPIPTFTSAGFKMGVVPTANLGPDQNYFRLFARKFAKLQVLMPGETADPGSLTGKTGTPTDQTVGVPFNVVVNAVDANWYPAAYASDHSIHLTCTDSTATLPADADLAGGTVTFSVTLNQDTPPPPFTFTVTASDVTDPTKTANTSSVTSVP